MVNKVYQGDCLEILQSLPLGSVDMVYLDPPFYSQKRHTLKSRTTHTEYSFDDRWQSLEDYLSFLTERLSVIRNVMKDNATIFFHCDRAASHHIRVMLDRIFGESNFVSEIIWAYRRWSNASKSLLNAHQTIFMYAKSPNYKFNRIMEDYSQTTNLDQILQKRERNQRGKSAYVKDEQGNVVLNGPKQGVPLSDVWQIPFLNPKARERVGYPTQKPILLLEQILAIATDEGDLVLDPFCGSGTTLVAAHLNNRHYIGIDRSHNAVELTQARLKNPIRSDSQLLQQGRSAYDALPSYVKDVLSQLPAKVVQRNTGIDAIYDQFVDGRPVVIRVQREGESLLDAACQLAKAGNRKNAARMFLIRLNQTVQQQFEGMIELPPEVEIIDTPSVAIQNLIRHSDVEIR